ncbi:MAG: Flp pilus assembly protein CpaB [Blastocatellia bacterium]|nr:Flp pilus assembly protein CpaB [Blastocatellia bacterium]
MRDKRFIIVIICAAVFGLVAAVLVGRYLTNVEGRSNHIVIARVDIPLSTRITIEQLAVQQLPRDATPAGTFASIEDAVGRVTVTKIGAREPLTEMKLAPEGTEPGLTAVISEGFRAITVKVDDVVGVSGFVEPGAWVDVVAVVSPVERSSEHGPTSKIVLQHIKVLATDKNIGKEKKENTIVSVKAVTLEVLPGQAEKLALAAAEGKLQLVMRNSVDKEDVQTTGVNKTSLLLGEHVVLPPPSETPESQAASPAPALYKAAQPRRRRPPPLNLMPFESKRPPGPRIEKTEAPPRPAPARISVEIFDGAKRHKVELP